MSSCFRRMTMTSSRAESFVSSHCVGQPANHNEERRNTDSQPQDVDKDSTVTFLVVCGDHRRLAEAQLIGWPPTAARCRRRQPPPSASSSASSATGGRFANRRRRFFGRRVRGRRCRCLLRSSPGFLRSRTVDHVGFVDAVGHRSGCRRLHVVVWNDSRTRASLRAFGLRRGCCGVDVRRKPIGGVIRSSRSTADHSAVVRRRRRFVGGNGSRRRRGLRFLFQSARSDCIRMLRHRRLVDAVLRLHWRVFLVGSDAAVFVELCRIRKRKRQLPRTVRTVVGGGRRIRHSPAVAAAGPGRRRCSRLAVAVSQLDGES
jgi:hypothetical protein